jgi:hypothetical protein
MKFDCDRGIPNCKVWRAGTLISDFITGEINCDTDKTSELCNKAREFLGDDVSKMKHSEIIGALADKTKEVFDNIDSTSEQAKLIKHTNEIWEAVTDYVCYKVPKECEAIR